jgi:hypothetical protein
MTVNIEAADPGCGLPAVSAAPGCAACVSPLRGFNGRGTKAAGAEGDAAATAGWFAVAAEGAGTATGD